MEYEKRRVADFNHWSAFLHDSQYYLGRMYLWARREDAVDFMQITPEEEKEFFEVGGDINIVLGDLFVPSIMNYAALGNDTSHLHVHFIPRYRTPRIYNDITFKDENWGKNYAPYDKNFSVPEKTMLKIRDVIKERLEAVRESCD